MHSPERLDFHEKKKKKKEKKATNNISFLINELSMENCTTCYLTLIKGLKTIKKLRGLFTCCWEGLVIASLECHKSVIFVYLLKPQ